MIKREQKDSRVSSFHSLLFRRVDSSRWVRGMKEVKDRREWWYWTEKYKNSKVWSFWEVIVFGKVTTKERGLVTNYGCQVKILRFVEMGLFFIFFGVVLKLRLLSFGVLLCDDVSDCTMCVIVLALCRGVYGGMGPIEEVSRMLRSEKKLVTVLRGWGLWLEVEAVFWYAILRQLFINWRRAVLKQKCIFNHWIFCLGIKVEEKRFYNSYVKKCAKLREFCYYDWLKFHLSAGCQE